MNLLLGMILRKRITLRGFIVFDDFGHLYPAFAQQMGVWVKAGKVQYREEVIDGLERAPAAFVGYCEARLSANVLSSWPSETQLF